MLARVSLRAQKNLLVCQLAVCGTPGVTHLGHAKHIFTRMVFDTPSQSAYERFYCLIHSN